jgi:Ni,Fe-hydrogenase III small subunit/formate hydrogenlyase subunit 6/NADH:ubiquinone oxidoreductase subunit I
MFEILRKSLSTGVVTTSYPLAPAEISSRARGRPEIDFAKWKDARPATAVCPTGALSFCDESTPAPLTAPPRMDGEEKNARLVRTAMLDLGKCTFCALCAEADPAIRMTAACELAALRRNDLKLTARYRLAADGTHSELLETRAAAGDNNAPSEEIGRRLKERIHKVLGRSLHVREVDAGSCNGCEVEIHGLNSPVYDVERFGIHFVASPRHADLLLVTGPVTRNMELALRKTYDAMPAPRLVAAVGACGCSGGIFGRNYATVGPVDAVLPVDVYIPGCPPNPHAILHGLLRLLGRLPEPPEQAIPPGPRVTG